MVWITLTLYKRRNPTNKGLAVCQAEDYEGRNIHGIEDSMENAVTEARKSIYERSHRKLFSVKITIPKSV